MGCSDAGSTSETAVPAEMPKTWELPEGMVVGVVAQFAPFLPRSLHVSRTGDHFGFMALYPKSDQRLPGYSILDTSSGRVDRVSDICMSSKIDVVDIGKHRDKFSRNGKYLLVHSMRLIAKINLATGQATEILSTQLPCASAGWWFGDDVAVSTVEKGPDAKTYPVKLVSSEGMAIRTLSVHGEIVAADRSGRFLVVLADPNNLTQSMPCNSLKAHVLIVSAQGKKLRDLGVFRRPNHPSDWEIDVSPSGAYVAFTVPSSRKEVYEGKTRTEVVSILDGNRRSVLGGTPIVVTDKGELLTWESNTTISNGEDRPGINMSWFFKISSADGKEEVLFGGEPKAAATIANGRLYYLSRHANGKYEISWKKFR